MIRKLLIVLLLIACVAPLLIKGPDGEPVMSLDDWKPELPESVGELAEQLVPTRSSSASSPIAARPTTVYRWQDEKGSWHFSDEPPPGSDLQPMEVSEANLMPAPELPPKQDPPPAATDVSPLSRIPGMTVSPGQLKETMENLDQLQEKVDARNRKLDESLD